MGKEILLVVEAVSNEKGVSEDVIIEALELALATATKKRFDEEVELRVSIDKESGEYETFRFWNVVEDDAEIEFPGAQLTLTEAKEKDVSREVEGRYGISVDSVEFGRIAAQTAKQVIVQKVREAERAQVVEAYRDKVGELVSGQVKKVTQCPHPDRKHYAKNMCCSCYKRHGRSFNATKCEHKDRVHYSKGKC